MASEICGGVTSAVKANMSPPVFALYSVSACATIAFYVITYMGMMGTFPGSAALGWTATGFGGAFLAIGLLKYSFGPGFEAQKKISLLTTALISTTMIAVGIFGGLGMLSMYQMAVGILVAQVVAIPLQCGLCCCAFKHSL